MKKIYLLLIILLLVGCGKKKIVGSKQIDSCPNCVFNYYFEGKHYGENGSILNDYTNDYKTLNHQIFLGHILDNNKKIIRGFACGIESGQVFCIEGTNDGSKYDDNIKVLKEVYGENKCEQTEESFICHGDLISGTNRQGTADVDYPDGIACMAISNETIICD